MLLTARTRMTDDELKQYPHAGGIFRIQTNVKVVLPIHFAIIILELKHYESVSIKLDKEERNIMTFAMNNINYLKLVLGCTSRLKQLWI